MKKGSKLLVSKSHAIFSLITAILNLVLVGINLRKKEMDKASLWGLMATLNVMIAMLYQADGEEP